MTGSPKRSNVVPKPTPKRRRVPRSVLAELEQWCEDGGLTELDPDTVCDLLADLAGARAERDNALDELRLIRALTNPAHQTPQNEVPITGAEWLALRDLVNHQAEDECLWFEAKTVPEAYLQQELRQLHAAVESAIPSAAGVRADDLDRLLAVVQAARGVVANIGPGVGPETMAVDDLALDNLMHRLDDLKGDQDPKV